MNELFGSANISNHFIENRMVTIKWSQLHYIDFYVENHLCGNGTSKHCCLVFCCVSASHLMVYQKRGSDTIQTFDVCASACMHEMVMSQEVEKEIDR